MRYRVTMSTISFQDYLVEAESRDEAIDKAIRGKFESYGDVYDSESNVGNVEVYNEIPSNCGDLNLPRLCGRG